MATTATNTSNYRERAQPVEHLMAEMNRTEPSYRRGDLVVAFTRKGNPVYRVLAVSALKLPQKEFVYDLEKTEYHLDRLSPAKAHSWYLNEVAESKLQPIPARKYQPMPRFNEGFGFEIELNGQGINYLTPVEIYAMQYDSVYGQWNSERWIYFVRARKEKIGVGGYTEGEIEKLLQRAEHLKKEGSPAKAKLKLLALKLKLENENRTK